MYLFSYLARENRIRKDAQQEFSNLFGDALEGIFQSTLDGKYTRVNPALARIYGYDSPEELLSTITDVGVQIHVEHMMFDQLQEQSASKRIRGEF